MLGDRDERRKGLEGRGGKGRNWSSTNTEEMAGRRPLSRPRTRLYDYNYSLGEQLYKPMVDRLDRKYSGSSRPADDSGLNVPRRPVSFAEEDDVHRRRSLSSLLGESSTSASTAAAQMLANLEEDDEMTSASLKRMRAARAAGRSLTLDDELADPDSITSRLKNRTKISMSDRLMDSVGLKTPDSGDLESDPFFKRRTLKDVEENGMENGTLTKWTAMKPTRRAMEIASAADAEEDAAAALRARRSRARIAEIENEMEELAERAAGRAGRRATVAQRLAEAAEFGDGLESTTASSSSLRVKKTSLHQSATSEKKSINY
ncbi:hypothetical protein J437_LFUL003778 [Ladona fulva]|uniref:Uncharacterized protein n=1 Tax=Ladona fulva TaxID=123851 RepID=A0A8K0JUI8_LADFU|nr:hypothetical protein J437_LFUL003778 [Ladona fulva]